MWEKLKLFCGYMRNLNRENSVFSLSSEAAYYLILNAVPFLMLLLNITFLLIAPYSSAIKEAIMSLPLGLETAAGRYANELGLIHQLIGALPYDLSKILNDQIDLILASRIKEISVAGALSLIFTAWASTQGIAVLVQAADPENYLNRYAPVLRYSKVWLTVRFKSLLFAVGMVGIIGLSFLLMLSGNLIFYSLHFIAEDYPVLEFLTRAPLYLWNIILYSVPFVLLLVILTMFYRYAPSRFHRHSWGRSFYTGLAVAVLWMVFRRRLQLLHGELFPAGSPVRLPVRHRPAHRLAESHFRAYRLRRLPAAGLREYGGGKVSPKRSGAAAGGRGGVAFAGGGGVKEGAKKPADKNQPANLPFLNSVLQGTLNLAGTQATRADIDVLNLAVHNSANMLDVRLPFATSLQVGVTDAHAGHHTFAAYFCKDLPWDAPP